MCRSTQFPVLPITLLLITASASAASFDCKLAKSPRERAVCGSPELSAKDSALSAAYTRLRSGLSPAAAAVVQADQRSWIAYLNLACPNGKGAASDIEECLADEYSNRLSDLKAHTPLAAGNALFTHHVAIFAPGALDPGNPHSSGFGTGSYSMPQIDNPTPQQQAFNTAIAAAVLKESWNDPKKPAATLQEATDNESSTQVTYKIAGQNPRLLAVNFEIFEFGHGAAHPSTRHYTFSWWLDAGRELQSTDIFHADSWQKPLAASVAAKLHQDKDRQPYLWTGAELRSGIRDGLANPRQWTISRDGLTITFGQYQVAAYVAGSPSVHFTWKELQPYLSASLHPEDLPRVVPPED